MTAQHKLLLAWILAGVIPFVLQFRSYLKFATPHKITQRIVVPPGLEKVTDNLPQFCPVGGMLLSGSWFNIHPTHYFSTPQGRLCHFVVPQFNVHGTFLIRSRTSEPYYTTPSNCVNDSFSYDQYFYHGSIGFYAFYEEQKGSYCSIDNTAYIVGQGLGTFDINGPSLAEDTGSYDYRKSYWYCFAGAIWLTYRVFVLRRSFISCMRHGRMCDEMNESLNRKEVVVFVQEQLRLAAHGATNYHRAVVLYLLVEGIMTDLFLLIANDGILAKIQYVSMGYNLSALLVMVFEMFESTPWLREKWRVRIKRLLFSYETVFVGEVITAALQQYSLTLLNRSKLKESRPAALAVSYYAWSLVGHGVFVLTIIALVISVRTLWALTYVWLNQHTWAIFTAPCCVDSALKLRNKMFSLGGYRLENGRLYYTTSALKAFGLLKMTEEDGAEFLVLRKIHWLKVCRDDLIVVGMISSHRVEPCAERPSAGVVGFCDRKLGGVGENSGNRQASYIQVRNKQDVPLGS
ncbi:hypothetical protein PHYSODRAFT_523171 [Phytophthora sojae]|uniref:Uncharacterized protein n=1 Tax=Phytophthora sojae (strain P6497) TaxID=1094619 RepID=G5A546_PHYSP|nr:hypothetical protein PHYSODRAFT_523171 [Phytophthora sojae]EGZ09795.1 hypothetical protein PHYSODRAFT_523171 [Phytophthora sojae]|eukprot:XP_009534656.1 hypothetical protein PHYSODRAFT_523171 [Phytophthora sojae]